MYIRKYVKTAKKFRYYHKKLWNEVIELMTTNEHVYGVAYLKDKSILKLFRFKEYIKNNCFGCQWTGVLIDRKTCKKNCLFDIESYCLDGLWQKVTSSEYSISEKIELAKQIRDFPVKPKLLEG